MMMEERRSVVRVSATDKLKEKAIEEILGEDDIITDVDKKNTMNLFNKMSSANKISIISKGLRNKDVGLHTGAATGAYKSVMPNEERPAKKPVSIGYTNIGIFLIVFLLLMIFIRLMGGFNGLPVIMEHFQNLVSIIYN